MNKHKLREEFVVKQIETEERNPNLSIDIDDAISLADLDMNIERTNNDFQAIPEANVPENTIKNIDISAMNLVIEKYEAKFALKLSSKHLLTREAINDIFTFCTDISTNRSGHSPCTNVYSAFSAINRNILDERISNSFSVISLLALILISYSLHSALK